MIPWISHPSYTMNRNFDRSDWPTQQSPESSCLWITCHGDHMYFIRTICNFRYFDQ